MTETKGWTYYLDEKTNRFGIRDEDGQHIATVEGGTYKGPGTFEKRAKLMAGSQELLDALQLLRKAVHDLHLLDVKKRFDLCVADAAAGKAITNAGGS